MSRIIILRGEEGGTTLQCLGIKHLLWMFEVLGLNPTGSGRDFTCESPSNKFPLFLGNGIQLLRTVKNDLAVGNHKHEPDVWWPRKISHRDCCKCLECLCWVQHQFWADMGATWEQRYYGTESSQVCFVCCFHGAPGWADSCCLSTCTTFISCHDKN